MTQDNVHLVPIAPGNSVRDAQKLAGLLRDCLSTHQFVSAAIGDETCIDITTVQLLLSARRLAMATGKVFTLATPHPDALRASLIRMGILDRAGVATSDADFWLIAPKGTERRSA